METPLKNRKSRIDRSHMSRESLYELYGNSSYGIAVYEVLEEGGKFHFKDFNDRAEEIDGVDRSQVMGAEVRDVFPGVEDFGLLEVMERVWRSGRPERHPIAIYRDSRIVGKRENFIYKLDDGSVAAVYEDRSDDFVRDEARYRKLIRRTKAMESVGIGYWEHDIATGIVTNLHCERVFEGVVPKNRMSFPELLELFHPDDRHLFIEKLAESAQCEQGDDSFIETARVLSPSRDVQWMEMRGNILRDEQRRPESIVGTVMNVTERKRTDELIREKEAMLRSVLGTSTAGIGMAKERVLQYLNNRLCEIVGYTSDELMGMNTRTIYPSDEEYERVGRDLYGMIENEGLGEIETRFLRKDGRIIEVSMSACPMDPDDLSAGVTFTVLDTTDRNKTENALVESEARFREMASMLPEIICETDLAGRITFVNDNALKVTGYTKEDVAAGLNVKQFFDPEDWEETKAGIRFLFDGQETAKRQLCVLRKDGSSFPALLQSAPILHDGEITGFRSIIMDSSEMAENIDKLQEAQEELHRQETEVLLTLERENKAKNSFIETIVLTVETKDPYTAGHQKRVSRLGEAIAREMGLPQEQVEGVRICGLIHDIGKISLPSEILSMPRQLTDIEFDLIKMHPEVGYGILKDLEFPWPVAEVALQHHERMDGSGYPMGIQGDEILLESRIIAVSDVVEAMAYHRPYRPALGMEKALEEIRIKAGSHFDPKVVRACETLIQRGDFQFGD